ncbi:MAG: SCP2 sterol-binding domain-containing protein [Candidatus Dormibacteria bacterium]
MSVLAYSPEWAAAFKNEINTSDAYKAAAATWEGTVSLVVLAEPDKHVSETYGVYMDLWHGEAREVRICSLDEANAADYVLTGSYSRWKQVAKKELDPIKAMVLGQIKLKGNFTTLVRYTKAAQQLVEATTRVDVTWPDETPV